MSVNGCGNRGWIFESLDLWIHLVSWAGAGAGSETVQIQEIVLLVQAFSFLGRTGEGNGVWE